MVEEDYHVDLMTSAGEDDASGNDCSSLEATGTVEGCVISVISSSMLLFCTRNELRSRILAKYQLVRHFVV